MSSNGSPQPDVVVIGGGPGGSTASTLIAQHGYRVQLFERERFPRFHIGESLIPETYWVLQRLNMLPKMKGSRFVKKFSVQFVNQHGKLSEPFYFMDQGLLALDRGDDRSALGFFRKELKRMPYDDQVHFALAVVELRLGDVREARYHMSLALENSTTRDHHDIYAAKLAHLQKLGADR